MVLEDYRNARHEDFVLAVMFKEITWDEVEDVILCIPGYPVGIPARETLKTAVEAVLAECATEPTEEERKTMIEEELKKYIISHLQVDVYAILLKHEGTYIDLIKMEVLDSKWKLKLEVPMNEYYKEGEYSFEEDEYGPYFMIDKKNICKFASDYMSGKFN